MSVKKKWVVDEKGFHSVSEFDPAPSDKTVVSIDNSSIQNSNNEEKNEIELIRGTWLEGDDGFQFNTKCKVRIEAKLLKVTSRKKISIDTFVDYNGEIENLGQQVEGFLDDKGVAEVEVILFYGEKYSKAIEENHEAVCCYTFKAKSSVAKDELESEALKMPQKEFIELKEGMYDDHAVKTYASRKTDEKGHGNGTAIKKLQENLHKIGVISVGNADGDFGSKTNKAVIEFQKAAAEKKRMNKDKTFTEVKDVLSGFTEGVFNKNCQQEMDKWLQNGYMLPQDYLTFPGTNFKYKKTGKTYNSCIVTLPSQLRSDFKKDIEKIIKEMHNLGFAFGVMQSAKAGYRTFQTQNDIDPTKTKAGPGESFHNYGLAVDLGVLNWVDQEGKSYNDFWLGLMDKIAKYKGFSSKIWRKRNSFCGNDVHSLSFETIHLQGVPAAACGRTALSNCLNKAASNLNDTSWEYRIADKKYECNLGTKDTWKNIGTAKQMWAGNATNCDKDQKEKIKKHMKKAESVALTIAV